MGAQDQRPRFYEGQYLAASDLAAIVDYLRASHSRHSLGAHTWGIAIGLYLVERPAPGAKDRVEAILMPGVAWDGYGRAIVVTRPTRLPETLFAAIPYVDSFDKPDAQGKAKGRGVRVWLNYSEVGARGPTPGFESCGTDDQSARVAESFEFVIGNFAPGPDRQGDVAVGPEGMHAEDALRHFDPPAPTLYDASVPQQTFPSNGRPPRWLIPVGYVRWVARDGDLGYFVTRDGVPDYRLADCTRGFRRYVGAVAENIVAADGAILLQRRDEDPRTRHRFAYLLNCGQDAKSLLEDLAWVEGNLRVVGNAKLAGGKLLMRDADGFDEGAPIYLARTGDDEKVETKKCCEDFATGAAGAEVAADTGRNPREFRAAIGAKGQNAHRFIVGPEVPPPAGQTLPTLEPRLVVLSGTGEKDDKDNEGRVGVNTRDPNAALEVMGDWNGSDGAIRVAGKQPTIRYEGGTETGDEKWIAQVGTTPKGAYRIAHWVTTTKAWKGVLHVTPLHRVGVLSTAPSSPLGIRAEVDANDLSKKTLLLASLEDAAGGTKWQLNFRVADGKKDLNFVETGVSENRLYLKAGGNVGVGTNAPSNQLHVNGATGIRQNRLYLSGGDGWSSLTYNAHHNAANTAWVFPDPAHKAMTVEMDDAGGATRFEVYSATGAPPAWTSHFKITGDNDTVAMAYNGGRVGIGMQPVTEKLEVRGKIKFGAVPDLFAMGANRALRAVVGTVNSNGSYPGGLQYTVVRMATGEYQVNLNPVFAAPPVVLVTPIDSSNADNLLTVVNVNANSFQVLARDVVGVDIAAFNAPDPQDTAFSFVAFGAA